MSKDLDCCRCEGWGYIFAYGPHGGSARDGQPCARCSATGREPRRLRPLYSTARVKERLVRMRARAATQGVSLRELLTLAARNGWTRNQIG